MLGFGAIEIEEATYNLGMCGHIIIRINATGKRYRVTHKMGSGLQVSEENAKDRTWSKSKRMTLEEIVALLPTTHGWTAATFTAVWAGFAAGYNAGRNS